MRPITSKCNRNTRFRKRGEVNQERDPSPEEIEARAAKIREGWDDMLYWRRRYGSSEVQYWELPVIKVTDWRLSQEMDGNDI